MGAPRRRASGSCRHRVAGAAVPGQFICPRRVDRLGRRAERPDLPADLSSSRHVARRGICRVARTDSGGRFGRGNRGDRPPDSNAHEPTFGRADDRQRPRAERRAATRPPAQVPRDGAVLPQRRTDLPRLLHVLLPVAAVRRHGGTEVRRALVRRARRLPRAESLGHRRADHRRRPAGHERSLARSICRAAPRPRARACAEHPHRDQIRRLLAPALRHRPGCGRAASLVREGRPIGPQPRIDGALQPPTRDSAPEAHVERTGSLDVSSSVYQYIFRKR